MAAAVTITKKGVPGDRRSHRGTLNLGAYATGGVAIPAAAVFGLSKIEELRVEREAFLGAATAANLRIIVKDKTNSKFLVFRETAGAIVEETNATDLSGMTLDFEAIGR